MFKNPSSIVRDLYQVFFCFLTRCSASGGEKSRTNTACLYPVCSHRSREEKNRNLAMIKLAMIMGDNLRLQVKAIHGAPREWKLKWRCLKTARRKHNSKLIFISLQNDLGKPRHWCDRQLRTHCVRFYTWRHESWQILRFRKIKTHRLRYTALYIARIIIV